LHVGHRHADVLADGADHHELLAQLAEQPVKRHDQPQSAEVLAVRVAGMRACPHTARATEHQHPTNRIGCSRVPATRDRSRRDELEHRLVVPHALAEVGVEIDAGHAPASSNAACALSSVTGWKRTSAPGRNCTNRSRSAEITVAMRGYPPVGWWSR